MKVGKYFNDEAILANHEHIKMAADWLLLAQAQSPDDGYARLYSLIRKKWDKSYIETTGYIIPSMMAVSKYLHDEKYLSSAKKAGKWLLTVQKANGAFTDIDGKRPLAFDTGQCLFGLIALFQETSEERYLNAAKRAGDWLVIAQDADGSWTRHGYLNRPHSYYTRVAAALLNLFTVTGKQSYHESADKFFNWVLPLQLDNGGFKNSAFEEGAAPFLHTMVYVLEGFIDAWKVTNDSSRWNAIEAYSATLVNLNARRDLLLYSQYDEQLQVANFEKCLVGLAQWAGVLLDLYAIKNDSQYKKLAVRTIYYLKSKQIKQGANLKGGLTGSIPFYGRYCSLQLLNWNAKFFIDALLKYEKEPLSLPQEQENWVSDCFGFKPGLVHEKIDGHEQTYVIEIATQLTGFKHQKATLLDIGCGKGKFLNYFRSRYPSMNIIGIDPVFYDVSKNIQYGTSYNLNLHDNTVDIAMSIEVLQHVKYLDVALNEIKRVLKKEGTLIIIDRSPMSVLGLLKPLLEKLGWWMYPPDSPFSEKWYSIGKWKKMLAQQQFNVVHVKSITRYRDIIPFRNRYYFIACNIQNASIGKRKK